MAIKVKYKGEPRHATIVGGDCNNPKHRVLVATDSVGTLIARRPVPNIEFEFTGRRYRMFIPSWQLRRLVKR